MQTHRFLAESTFFKELTEPSRRALAAIAECREFRKRQTLFREGQPGDALYILRCGHIQLHKAAPDGSEVVIKTVQPNEVFGEVILFEQDRYPVTAVALTEGEVVRLPRRDIHHLLANMDFRNDFLAMLMRKQRYLTDRIVQLTSHDAEARLLHFLREHFGGSRVVEVTMSKKDIAASIGTTPETLSRVLQTLRRRGVLTWKGRSLTWPAGR
jgi:CRP-like cAMP-binding protein